jgi:glucosylglycerate phosphorylase
VSSQHRLELLRSLYGDAADDVERRARTRTEEERVGTSRAVDERDAWLIAYADSFVAPDQVPLVTLRDVIDRYWAPEISGVHVLPFHPSSSDRGFSVMDYAQVEPSFGTWDDVAALASGLRLMADAVVNHLSAEGVWFQAFLAGDRAFERFFRAVDPAVDLSAVVRPRTLPLVTEYEGVDGPIHLWTTFSADQVDLDYRNPEVLLAVLDVLLRYRAAGASAIRLDAIAFIWKVEGSPSINLDETHEIIEILRAWLDEVDPGLMLVTETNVPHPENVAYLGRSGRREAQAVYQFALPPLLLHTLSTADPTAFVAWASSLGALPPGCTYLNFTSSHDGVGLRPVEGVLSAAAITALVEVCERGGGTVNRRRLPDGSAAPYELASTWYSLMAAIDPEPDRALAKHLLSQAFVLALQGIPLLYVHVLLASQNDVEGYQRSGIARDLNRRDLRVRELEQIMSQPSSRSARATSEIRRMLQLRASSTCFHPDASQRIWSEATVVVVERVSQDGDIARVLLNVGSEPVAACGSTVPPLSSVWLL